MNVPGYGVTCYPMNLLDGKILSLSVELCGGQLV